MKIFLARLRNTVVAGFLFLLPVYVLLVVVTRVWTSLSSVGTTLAGMFGLTSILGVGGSTVLSGVLLMLVWLGCGLLVRLPFISRFSKATERWLVRYIPGYEAYRMTAEEKVRLRTLPYTSALIKHQEFWRPAYLVEQDGVGNCVVFLPSVPDTNRGSIVLATRDELRLVPSMPANALDASLKRMGRGLLSHYGIHQR
jgi:hypothetical protein